MDTISQFTIFVYMLRAAKILFISLALLFGFHARAQLLTRFDPYRNQLFANSGYYLSFANYGFGWIHGEHIKFLKRDVAGILDFSFPVTSRFNTRFVFRKGLQTNIWQDSTWRIPIAIIGSSDKIITDLFRIHNFVTDFFLAPGIYRKRYTVALDLGYHVVWFSHYKRTAAGEPLPAHHNKIHSILETGLAMAYNYKRFSYLLRTGYQQKTDVENHPLLFYAIAQVGYNLNFRKRK